MAIGLSGEPDMPFMRGLKKDYGQFVLETPHKWWFLTPRRPIFDGFWHENRGPGGQKWPIFDGFWANFWWFLTWKWGQKWPIFDGFWHENGGPEANFWWFLSQFLMVFGWFLMVFDIKWPQNIDFWPLLLTVLTQKPLLFLGQFLMFLAPRDPPGTPRGGGLGGVQGGFFGPKPNSNTNKWKNGPIFRFFAKNPGPPPGNP